jgi:hypothetical protein
MEKKLITETIFRTQNDESPITFGEINIPLEPNDVIIAGHDEGFYSENNSWDPHYFLEITRDRLETDEEFAERVEEESKLKVDMKKRRYEHYLKLKKEFENE